MRSDVRGGSLVDRTLFPWRYFGLKLIGDGLGDLTLDGENIGQVPVIFLRPDMSVITGVDQLRAHSDTIGRALHAAFQHVRYF